MCATHTPLIQRCISLLRYENLHLFLLNISFSHTNTNSVSQGLIFLHCSLVCLSHTLSLPRDILRSLICLSSYHSCCEISFSLADTKLRLSGSHFSLIFVYLLYVAHTHTLSLEIYCIPSYVSLAITLVVKYLSLSQTQNSVSRDLISL